ncbi:hypothetical protein K438DRAFT_1975475 [Mycena galopus ATCC 62051]|nr:hypothetical protein K438DRAFT_1975475 [Mycena galopus ATCC 62051]
MSPFVLFTGPILVGTQLNWALLGVLLLQVFGFYRRFSKERTGIKALVCWLLFLDLAQTAFSSHFAFEALVSRWGDPAVFVQLPWSSCSIPVLTGLISASVQIFFAWRIYALEGHKNRYIFGVCGLIVILALMQGLSAVVNGVREGISSQLADFLQLVIGVKVRLSIPRSTMQISWLSSRFGSLGVPYAMLLLIGSAVCDVVIAGTMIVILTKYRKMTPWKKTDTIITKLIYHTVETGAVTAIVAILDMVLFLIYPQYLFHVVPSFILGKIYSNVVLATLNARTINSRGGETKSETLPVSVNESHELQWRTPTARTEEDATHKVHVSTVTVITNDVSTSNIPNHGTLLQPQLV